MNLEIVSMWQAKVVDIKDDKITYKTATDDNVLDGSIGWGAVLPPQRSYVVTDAEFLLLVGLVMNGQDSVPVVFALFGAPPSHKVDAPAKP